MPGGATRENLRVAFHPVSGWQWVSQTRTLHPAEYLKEQLDTYMSQFPKVKILRLKERHGLIRARLAGAEIAKGRMGAMFQPCQNPRGAGHPSPALRLSLSVHQGCPFVRISSPSSTTSPSRAVSALTWSFLSGAGKKRSWLWLGRSGEPRGVVAQLAAP